MVQGIWQKKSLIVCYSYSGNTWKVAEEIRRQTGAVLCEIYPKQPYPMLFESLLARVRWEVEAGFLPGLFPINERIEDYGRIFVGTPNWCGTVAPPITAFLKGNNMEGRLLMPFYSHCGGGKGNVEEDIRRMCPGATVGEGISVVNDGGSTLAENIAFWLKKIDWSQ